MSEVQDNKDPESNKANPNDTLDAEEKKEEEIESKTNDESVDNENNEDETGNIDQDEDQVILTKKEFDELKKSADESGSHLDKLLRARAEFMNYQKRMRKENENIAQYAVQNLIMDILPELDNFERAVKLADNPKDTDKFVEGIKLIETQLFKVLGKYGVEYIETLEKPFDPKLHEAVIEEENNELPHHTVIEEYQRGFLLKDRVIRPSKVKVSKRACEEETKNKEEGPGEVNGNSEGP